MTIALSYDSNLSRVQIVLSDLHDGTVRVERSSNELLWRTVRGGQELTLVDGEASLDDYEFDADVENFYRVVPIEPPAGLVLTGESGDYASTPDHASLDITGDIDLRAEISPVEWDGGIQSVASKYTSPGNQRAYRIYIHPVQGVRFAWAEDGTSATAVSPNALPPGWPDVGRLAFAATMDVDNGDDEHVITFYIAPSIDTSWPWTQLGDPVVRSGITNIADTNAILEVGTHSEGATDPFEGIIHAVEVRQGIDGTVVADPDFVVQDNATGMFVDDAGREWTVNGDAHIIGQFVEQDSITPSLEGQVWLKSVRFPFLNRPITVTEYSDIDRASRTALFEPKGRSMPIGVSDLRGSQSFTLDIMTETLEAARDMDLILASGSTMFVHVPPNCPVPGGYVEIADAGQARRSTRGTRRFFTLPCQVTVPPSPSVVGTTLTWGGVFQLYGNWEALINDNPTWADLLSTVGSPDDLVSL
jgi:hypothetical protein